MEPGSVSIRRGDRRRERNKHPIIHDRYIATVGQCVVEFEVEHPEPGRVAIVDIFDINHDGEFTRLAVYRR